MHRHPIFSPRILLRPCLNKVVPLPSHRHVESFERPAAQRRDRRCSCDRGSIHGSTPQTARLDLLSRGGGDDETQLLQEEVNTSDRRLSRAGVFCSP
jgi:hypothetical protein